MAEVVFVIGPSGSGKSTSGRNLSPQSTYWINCDQKALPFRGWKSAYSEESKNYTKVADLDKIKQILVNIPVKLPNVNTIVIDTMNRMMTDRVMKDRTIKGYDKWTNLAGGIYDIVKTASEALPDNIIVFIMAHVNESIDDSGVSARRIMTAGKQLDKIVLESMSSIVLFTKVDSKGEGKNSYHFETQSDGYSTAKSPEGMFESFLVPNDLEIVRSAIINYNQGSN
jgi:adenylate kinase family enzyme